MQSKMLISAVMLLLPVSANAADIGKHSLNMTKSVVGAHDEPEHVYPKSQIPIVQQQAAQGPESQTVSVAVSQIEEEAEEDQIEAEIPEEMKKTFKECIKKVGKLKKESKREAIKDCIKILKLKQPKKTESKKTESSSESSKVPYGDLEAFGREDTAKELTEVSKTESNEMVDQLERAEVAEEKRSVFRALTRLRGLMITSYDGSAKAQVNNIVSYAKNNKFRDSHPLKTLAEEESDVSKWAFAKDADLLQTKQKSFKKK